MKNITKLLVIFLLTSSFLYINNGKEKKSAKKAPVTKTCVCNTPGNPTATRVGSNVILSWNSVPGAICYAYGGYYTTDGSFMGNTSSTSVQIPWNGGGTWQVRAICEGTCTNATCSSTPTGPQHF